MTRGSISPRSSVAGRPTIFCRAARHSPRGVFTVYNVGDGYALLGRKTLRRASRLTLTIKCHRARRSGHLSFDVFLSASQTAAQ